jgi:hypothetical protein
MQATKCTNTTFCVLLHKLPDTLQMPEEAYYKAEMKEMQVYEWYKHFL